MAILNSADGEVTSKPICGPNQPVITTSSELIITIILENPGVQVKINPT